MQLVPSGSVPCPRRFLLFEPRERRNRNRPTIVNKSQLAVALLVSCLTTRQFFEGLEEQKKSRRSNSSQQCKTETHANLETTKHLGAVDADAVAGQETSRIIRSVVSLLVSYMHLAVVSISLVALAPIVVSVSLCWLTAMTRQFTIRGGTNGPDRPLPYTLRYTQSDQQNLTAKQPQHVLSFPSCLLQMRQCWPLRRGLLLF